MDFRDLAKIRLEVYKAKAYYLYPELSNFKRFQKIKLIFTDENNGLAGQAWISSYTIELNTFWCPAFTDTILDQVLGHELCHIITPLIYGMKHDGHSFRWKETMIKMGFKPELKIHFDQEDL